MAGDFGVITFALGRVTAAAVHAYTFKQSQITVPCIRYIYQNYTYRHVRLMLTMKQLVKNQKMSKRVKLPELRN